MYWIVTELERMRIPFDTLDDALSYAQQNFPLTMIWEIRDEDETVVYTHYNDEE